MTLSRSSGSHLKPIETQYKGYRFRSRLEARWAVFFDALGIEWEYEPEGFDLGDGLYYLPDFRLRGRWGNIWLEIKGSPPNEKEVALATKLHQQSKEEVLITWDNLEPRDRIDFLENFGETFLTFQTNIINGIFSVTEHPGLATISLLSQFMFTPSDNIKRAFTAARSARFEHGESP
jgi:hypothetical protein